jgi:hypothetical protein
MEELFAAQWRYRRTRRSERDEDEKAGGEDDEEPGNRRPLRPRTVSVRQSARCGYRAHARDDGVSTEGRLADQEDDGGETEQRDRKRKRGPATGKARKEPRGKRRTDGREHAEHQ